MTSKHTLIIPLRRIIPTLALAATMQATSAANDKDTWWQAGQQALSSRLQPAPLPRAGAAKNVILFVGDGMSVTTVTAARILAGQKKGRSGEEHWLSFERFPYTALAKTYNTNQQTPDSAGTMTAMVTGVKTKAGVISLNDSVGRGRCENIAQNQLTSILELAERQGKSTGIVSTARLTHATPAASYAKSPERNWEDDSAMPDKAKQKGCTDIAQQFANFNMGDGIEVALGGGRRHFLPTPEGRRSDGQNLIKQWQQKYPDGIYVNDRQSLLATKSPSRLLGLFNEAHMRFDEDNREANSPEPSLAEMTAKAIDVVSDNPQGFLLIIEAGRIDHAHHAGNAYHALHDTLALSDAVKTAINNTKPNDTLMVVTADHSHVFTMAGYPTRGNPILGYVIANNEHGEPEPQPYQARDGLPYTTLGYHNGPGARPRVPEPQSSPETDDYHQHAAIPLISETHGGEDVAIYATGPGSQLFHGVMEQNVIFHLLAYAGGLTVSK